MIHTVMTARKRILSTLKKKKKKICSAAKFPGISPLASVNILLAADVPTLGNLIIIS